MSMRNTSDNFGNGIRDLPACSAVDQPPASQRALGGEVKTSYFICVIKRTLISKE